jgi:hypothetical protein
MMEFSPRRKRKEVNNERKRRNEEKKIFSFVFDLLFW